MSDRNGDNGNSSALFLGFVVGAIVGAVVGMLFAPQAGAESRSSLFDGGFRMRDRARNLGETGGEALKDAISEGRDAAGRARNEMEDWARRSREDGDGNT
jgi:gas vesicle protein